jgi:hypothetical protein
MFKRTILAVAVVAVTCTGVVLAQHDATLILRSGERLNVQLVDLGGSGFTVRVNGQERTIPANDVSVIDFTGATMTDADWAKIADGQQVIWLRNGDLVNGSLYDIGGTSPLRLTVKTNNGEREFSSNEVGRIILSRPTNAVATTGTATPASGAGIAVSANQQWTPTGITVRKGEVITFNTTGEVQLSTDPNDVATPAGAKSARRAPGAPLPGVLAGALIGRVANGQPFGIGTSTSVPMPAAGQLFLGVNDDGMGDNVGAFRVEIQRSGVPIRR